MLVVMRCEVVMYCSMIIYYPYYSHKYFSEEFFLLSNNLLKCNILGIAMYIFLQVLQ